MQTIFMVTLFNDLQGVGLALGPCKGKDLKSILQGDRFFSMSDQIRSQLSKRNVVAYLLFVLLGGLTIKWWTIIPQMKKISRIGMKMLVMHTQMIQIF